MRVVEILGGDPDWSAEGVTLDSLRRSTAAAISNTSSAVESPNGTTEVTTGRPPVSVPVLSKTMASRSRPRSRAWS